MHENESKIGQKLNDLMKLLPKDKITEQNPFLLQQFCEGDLVCSYSVIRNGKIRVHSAYRGGEFTSSSSGCGATIGFFFLFFELILFFVLF